VKGKARPTQAERVLRALRRAGARRITAVDFLGPATYDGGPPVLNLAGRVNELRRAHEIVAAGRRDRCVRYVLREPKPTSEPPPAPGPPAPGPPLYERAVGAAPPRCAIFDEDA
jgi:hypothetical protein